MDRGELQDAAAGAGGFVTLGGQDYEVSPPTDADARTIARFLRKQAKSPTQRLRDDPDFGLLDPDEQRAALKQAAKRKFDADAPLDPHSAMDALLSLEGCRFMAFVVLRRKNRGLTRERVAELVTEENYEEVFDALDGQTGMGPLGDSDGPRG
jgi:hypothetical protein